MQEIFGLLLLFSIGISAQFTTTPTPALANVLTEHTESTIGEIPLPTVLADEAVVEAKQTAHTESSSVGELPLPSTVLEAKQTAHTESSVGELPLPTVMAAGDIEANIEAEQTPHTESSVGELPLPTIVADSAAAVDAHVDAKQTPHTEHSVGALPVPTLADKRAPKGGRREAFRG